MLISRGVRWDQKCWSRLTSPSVTSGAVVANSHAKRSGHTQPKGVCVGEDSVGARQTGHSAFEASVMMLTHQKPSRGGVTAHQRIEVGSSNQRATLNIPWGKSQSWAENESVHLNSDADADKTIFIFTDELRSGAFEVVWFHRWGRPMAVSSVDRKSQVRRWAL